MKKTLIMLAPIILLLGCATLQRMAGAGLGAIAGSPLGPPGIIAGAATGEAAVELWQGDEAVGELEDRVDIVEKALTTGDVSDIVLRNSEGIMHTVWMWIKAIIVGGIVLFLVAVFYTLRRKSAAQEKYNILKELKEWKDSLDK